MAFKKDHQIAPSEALLKKVSSVVFRSARNTYAVKSARQRRQCYCCGGTIDKNSPYVSHSFRYSGRIITVYFRIECFGPVEGRKPIIYSGPVSIPSQEAKVS